MAAAGEPERGEAAGGEGGLKRVLGLFDVTMIVMGCIIGAGVFKAPAVIAGFTGSIGGILGVWGLGGVIALTGAFVFAELGVMFPRTGGEYVFIKEPFGRFPAFMFGWLMLAAIVSNAVAFVATVFADHLEVLVRQFGSGGFVAFGSAVVGKKLVAGALIVVFTLVNIRGVRLGATIQNVAMVAKILGIVTVIALGAVAIARGDAFADRAAPEAAGASNGAGSPGVTLATFMQGMFAAMFTYGGWQNVTTVSSEIKNPQRTLPIGIVVGTIAVVALYLLLNVSLVAILGVHGVASSDTPTADAAGCIFAGGKLFVSALVMTSTFAITQALLFVTPRIYFAMSNDGLFFRSVGKVHPRYGTPWVAIALQGGFTIVCLTLGSVLGLMQLATLFDWLAFTLCGLGLFVLRRTRPNWPRPYRATGYPYLPAIFLALSAFVFVMHLPLAETAAIERGAVIFGAGLVLFLFFRRANAPAAPTGGDHST